MSNINTIEELVSGYVLEIDDKAERIQRARDLAAVATSMIILLEGSKNASERLYRFADHAVTTNR